MASDAQQERNDHVSVFLRYFSKDCAEVKEGISSVHTEDDRPVQNGENGSSRKNWESEFNGIFEEGSLQEEVFETVCHHLPQQLCEGYNCTIISYGPRGTGKTYTLLGKLPDINKDNTMPGDAHCVTVETGMVPRLVHKLFDKFRSFEPGVELTVRCSVVELHLNRFRDLLHEKSLVRVKNDGSLVGCAALSCVSPEDVTVVLRRARAVRNVLTFDSQNISNRSTLIVQFVLEQNNSRLRECKRSRLLVVDMAACDAMFVDEQAGDAQKAEASILSQSFEALQQQLQTIHDQQQLQQEQPVARRKTSITDPNSPMLVQLLSNSFSGSCYTSVILHTPSNDNTTSEMSPTIKFGISCRKISIWPEINLHCLWQECFDRVAILKARQDQMENFILSLASESYRFFTKGGVAFNKNLLAACEKIQDCIKDKRAVEFVIETKTEHENRLELLKLRSELRLVEVERDEVLSREAQANSDIIILKSQLELLRTAHDKQKSELSTLKAENFELLQRKFEVEHNLRTSLFRENEAVVFLRQFRKFYFRLLQKTAWEGNGSFTKVAAKIPNAPDVEEFIDFDKLMLQSGLLEEEEVGVVTTTKHYCPSKAALSRSAAAAEEAELKLEVYDESDLKPFDATGAVRTNSILKRHEPGGTTEARQHYLLTPSGQAVNLSEAHLEKELAELSKKYSLLKATMDREKAVLSTRDTQNTSESGMVKALQQIKDLQSEGERRNSDLKTFIFKMNEIHLSSKILKEKLQYREQHVQYLEDHTCSMEKSISALGVEKVRTEFTLRAENSRLHEQLFELTKPFRVDVQNPNGLSIDNNIARRIVVPFSIKTSELQKTKGLDSLKGIEFAADLTFVAHSRHICSSDDSWSKEHFFLRNAANDVTRVAVGVQTDQCELPQSSISTKSHESLALLPRGTKVVSANDYLFVDEDESVFSQVRRGHQSNIDGLLDAYNSTSHLDFDIDPTLSQMKQSDDLSSPTSVQYYKRKFEAGAIGLANESITNLMSNSLHDFSSTHNKIQLVNSLTAPINHNQGAHIANESISNGDLALQLSSTICDLDTSMPGFGCSLEKKCVVLPVKLTVASTGTECTTASSYIGTGNASATSLMMHDSQLLEPQFTNQTGENHLLIAEESSSVAVKETPDNENAAATVAETTEVRIDSDSEHISVKNDVLESVERTSKILGPEKIDHPSSFMSKLRAQAAKKFDEELGNDDAGTTPEWLKKFRTIGAKNAQEEVIEAQGKAPATELTRAAFGESLRHADKSVDTRAYTSLATTTKWVPRKKKADDDSDSDDSFARAFMKGASVPVASESAKVDSPRKKKIGDSDGSDSDDSFARGFMKGVSVPVTTESAKVDSPQKEKIEDADDSDSDDSFARAFMKGASVPVTTEPAKVDSTRSLHDSSEEEESDREGSSPLTVLRKHSTNSLEIEKTSFMSDDEETSSRTHREQNLSESRDTSFARKASATSATRERNVRNATADDECDDVTEFRSEAKSSLETQSSADNQKLVQKKSFERITTPSANIIGESSRVAHRTLARDNFKASNSVSSEGSVISLDSTICAQSKLDSLDINKVNDKLDVLSKGETFSERVVNYSAQSNRSGSNAISSQDLLCKKESIDANVALTQSAEFKSRDTDSDDSSNELNEQSLTHTTQVASSQPRSSLISKPALNAAFAKHSSSETSDDVLRKSSEEMTVEDSSEDEQTCRDKAASSAIPVAQMKNVDSDETSDEETISKTKSFAHSIQSPLASTKPVISSASSHLEVTNRQVAVEDLESHTDAKNKSTLTTQPQDSDNETFAKEKDGASKLAFQAGTSVQDLEKSGDIFGETKVSTTGPQKTLVTSYSSQSKALEASESDNSSDEATRPHALAEAAEIAISASASDSGSSNTDSDGNGVTARPTTVLQKSETTDSDHSSEKQTISKKVAVSPKPSMESHDNTEGSDGDDESEKSVKNARKKTQKPELKPSKATHKPKPKSKSREKQKVSRINSPRSIETLQYFVNGTENNSQGPVLPANKSSAMQSKSSVLDESEEEASDLDSSIRFLGSSVAPQSVTDSYSTQNSTGQKEKKEKAAFVIKDGKLVKNESCPDRSSSTLLSKKKEKRYELTMQPKTASLRKSRTNASLPSTPVAITEKVSPFAIKDGKLVKATPYPTAPPCLTPISPAKPSFSIVNGKLVKSEDIAKVDLSEKKIKKKKKPEGSEKEKKPRSSSPTKKKKEKTQR